jgi:hypothetical protein
VASQTHPERLLGPVDLALLMLVLEPQARRRRGAGDASRRELGVGVRRGRAAAAEGVAFRAAAANAVAFRGVLTRARMALSWRSRTTTPATKVPTSTVKKTRFASRLHEMAQKRQVMQRGAD